MTTYAKRIWMIIVAMIVIAIAVVWTIRERFFQPELLTIQEAVEKAETLYAGSIESFEQVGETYEMTLERDGKIFKIVTSAKTGDMSIVNVASITESASIYKSEKQIAEIVAKQNKGNIQKIVSQKTDSTLQYVVDVVQGENTRTLVVDAKTGEIVSERLKTANVTTNKEPNVDTGKTNNGKNTENTKDTTTSSNKNTNGKGSTANPNTIISQSRAIQIARTQLKGEVDDVKYEKTADGGYYLIEIEGKDSEAIFQIHAVSGKIMSITQDDDPDTSDDRDDD